MNNSKGLDAAVHEVIKAGKIGQPVFVRYFVRLTNPKRSDLLGLLADSVLTIQAWMDHAIERVHTAGGYAEMSVLVQFRDGATALVSLVNSGAQDLIVLGNEGAIYYDGFAGVSARLATNEHSDVARSAVRSVLEESARSGKPQVVRLERP